METVNHPHTRSRRTVGRIAEAIRAILGDRAHPAAEGHHDLIPQMIEHGDASEGRRDVAQDDTLEPAWKVRPEHMSEATWRMARFLSTCGNPMVISVPCFFAASCKATPRWSERLRWWGIATAVMTITPFVHVRWGVRTGRFSDHEVSRREERFWPYVVEVSAVGLSYAILRVLSAPAIMIALVLSVAIAMVVVTGVTLFWKLSMHVTGTAGAATVLLLLYGRRALPVALLVPLVGWSRYILDHHTPAQALAGALVGSLAPLIVFRRMRPV